MSKVLTFSRYFPSHHPRKGEPTFFVEKIWNSTGVTYYMHLEDKLPLNMKDGFKMEPKYHTIRSGNRWKVGDKFSPRVWSGKPYNSKQIVIGSDIEVKKVWNFVIHEYKDGYWIDFGCHVIQGDFNQSILPMLARNDGLELQDFLDWFKYPSPFEGQIICWNENINY